MAIMFGYLIKFDSKRMWQPKPTKHNLLILCFISCIALNCCNPVFAQDPKTAETLPRICIKDGKFTVKGTGKVFCPRGFNYIRLSPIEEAPLWHSTFRPNDYDGKRAEAMFANLEKHGFNIVRVFIDHLPPHGIVSSAEAKSLSVEYMANFFHFLNCAKNHNIYVVTSLVFIPRCCGYQEILVKKSDKIEGINEIEEINLFYLDKDFIKIKAKYVQDFVATIKKHRPDLLTTIFAFELDNETHLNAQAAPFTLTSGNILAANGKKYDLSSDNSLQQMVDDNVNFWADTCFDAIRRIDPEAMVSTNVFSYTEVGRSGPGKLRQDSTIDVRFPARPLALTNSKLSYLDIHLYLHNNRNIKEDLESIEFSELTIACQKRGKPLLMGEFGAFKKEMPNLSDVADTLKKHLVKMKKLGFAGYLYWSYDCDKQEGIWNAKSGEYDDIFYAIMSVHLNP
jgi:hypothetical protein